MRGARLFSIAILAVCAAAQSGEPIRHTLSFPERQGHYAHVSAVFPTDGRKQLELMMAVWTPGSYLVREYSRNVFEFQATADGQPVAVAKTRKNRWRIDTGGAKNVEVRYRVYSHEASVRSNWVDGEQAILNGAPTFFVPVGDLARPHEVTLELPPEWSRAVTPLPLLAASKYRAADYDTLVDSPILAGNPEIHEFTVESKKHYLVQLGDTSGWKTSDALRDLEKIVRAHLRLWGALPYQQYYFLNVLMPGGGGLEHKDSTLMMVAANMGRTPAGYRRWLGLASHESFHAWNGKRLRPVELGPFDYENEVYSRSLWMAEGITSYYGMLALHRAGLSTRAEFLQALGSVIASLQSTPGRRVVSLEQASLDAWIRQYRPDENSANASVSYYTKGAVLGFLLDAKLRQATDGRKTLDDWMRLAFDRYSSTRGFTPRQLRAMAEEISGASLSDFWRLALETTEEFDYKEAAEWFGLQLQPTAGAERGSLGFAARMTEGNPRISAIVRGGPAYEAGLQVDDELIAIDGERVRDDWETKVQSLKRGATVPLLVARRGRMTTLSVKANYETPRLRLVVNPSATAGQKRHLDDWLR